MINAHSCKSVKHISKNIQMHEVIVVFTVGIIEKQKQKHRINENELV